MLRIAIAEDTLDDRNKLKEFIDRYSRESGEACYISEFSNGSELLKDYHPVYDLILLDVKMPVIDGLETAIELRAKDTAVLIMFITNMAQYAVKGYEVDALDYVIKPISYYPFALKLRKVQRIFRERSQASRMIPFEGELRRVPVSSILYVEIADHKLCYHTYEGDSTVTGSLKVLEEELKEHHFARCNNCYLVNLIHVRSITPELVFVEDTPLKISRPRRKEFMQALSNYYGGGGR